MNTPHRYLVRRAIPADHPTMTELWEGSVRATHEFLSEADIAELRELILNNYLPRVESYVLTEPTGGPFLAFLGITNPVSGSPDTLAGRSASERSSVDRSLPGYAHIEMLFVRPDARGRGIGKYLIRYAVEKLGSRTVDVNEQNAQAVGFYEKMGFTVTERQETDALGRSFPILHMALRGR